MSLADPSNLSDAYIGDLFDEYDHFKSIFKSSERPFSVIGKSLSCSGEPTTSKEKKTAPLSSPLPRRGTKTSSAYSREQIRSCIISIRKWYSHRSSNCLPALIPNHKCTVNCHKDNGPFAVHRMPLVYGCELSGILHYCGPPDWTSTCEWTHTDPRTCSRSCVFAINKIVGEWISPVDSSYGHYKASKLREVSQGCDAFDYSDDDDAGVLGGGGGGGDSLFTNNRELLFDSDDFGSWDDLDKDPFDHQVERDCQEPPSEGYGSEQRIHNTIFDSIHKQKACNTYNHTRVKRRKRANERARESDSSSYNKSLIDEQRNVTSIYLVETGIKGDAFYICTPKGDTLGHLLGGTEIPYSEFPGDGIDPLYITSEEKTVDESSSDVDDLFNSSGVRKPLSKLTLEAEIEEGGGDVTMKEEIPRQLLTVSQMEELDNQALQSDVFLNKFNEMSISLSIPISTAGSNYSKVNKTRGPSKGYKKRFTNKVETVPGQEIGVVGFYDRYNVSGMPTFSSAEGLKKYVDREKKELGYLDGDEKRTEELATYNIYDILRDRVVEEINSDIPGYLPKKERYKMKKGHNPTLRGSNDYLFKSPSPVSRRTKPVSSLSMSSPSLSGGTPIRTAHRQTPRSLTASSSPSSMMFGKGTPMRGRSTFMAPTPSPMRESSLFFGSTMDRRVAYRNMSSPALMILSGSTPSRSVTPGSVESGSEHIRWRGMAKDVSAMRKWPVGKTIADQTKVVEIVGEKVHRVIIDLLVDRGPRRSIATIRKLSRKDDFMRKAMDLFNSHNSYKTKAGIKLPVPVNYHTLYTLWRKTCGTRVEEKRPPEFPIERQIAMKEMIVKCWMLLSRSDYSSERNKKKSSVFSFIVGMLYVIAYDGYISVEGVVVIEEDPWLKENLPTGEDFDYINKRKIGTKSNRGFSCKDNLASKSTSVGALAPRDVKIFGEGTNRVYNRRVIGEGIGLVKHLMNQYEDSGHGIMSDVREYLLGGEVAIDKLILNNPFTGS